MEEQYGEYIGGEDIHIGWYFLCFISMHCHMLDPPGIIGQFSGDSNTGKRRRSMAVHQRNLINEQQNTGYQYIPHRGSTNKQCPASLPQARLGQKEGCG